MRSRLNRPSTSGRTTISGRRHGGPHIEIPAPTARVTGVRFRLDSYTEMQMSKRPKLAITLVGFLTLASVTPGFAQGASLGVNNPFSPPDATIHYAPERMYHLQNLILDLKVDYENRRVDGVSTNTVIAIRDGVTKLRFHAGLDTKIEDVELDGRTATYARDSEGILVDCPPTKTGAQNVVTVRYHLKKSEVTHTNPSEITQGSGSWHWHEPVVNDPSKVGFWTNGETMDTRDWAVTWDYPNDFASTETRTTVPADWQVISNGVLVSDKASSDHKTHTVVWKMAQPHATYLTSIVAGPFDIHMDAWHGMPLYYVAPKGKGKYLDYTFGHTKDMLSFFVDSLGVNYPWPKYAQDCTYDFGGGQENVSATTLGEAFLTDPRYGNYAMDSLNSHELAHQWFGDYVTCKDWGQIWLNESFATMMEMTYTEHSHGQMDSLREVEDYSQQYFDESRRYKRPIVTNLYLNSDILFDEHTYDKGAVLLFSLRKKLGTTIFNAGLHNYLTAHGDSPVETNDLCEALTDSSGINLHPWFDQWIYKPGHPVIDWSWTWDENKKSAVVHVSQTQDTSQGTPIYDVETKIGIITPGGRVDRVPIRLTRVAEDFVIPATEKPSAVLFDPDHDFLREIPKQPWSKDELMSVFRFAPDPVSRQATMDEILAGSPSDADIETIAAALQKDQGPFPAILSTQQLSSLKKVSLRSFWESELKHDYSERRVQAVQALGSLPKDPQETNLLRSLINDEQPYRVVAAAITAISDADFPGNEKIVTDNADRSQNYGIRSAAMRALAQHKPEEGKDCILKALDRMQPDDVQLAGLAALGSVKDDDPRIDSALREALTSIDPRRVYTSIRTIGLRKSKGLLPDLEKLAKDPNYADPAKAAISQIQG